MFSDAPVICLRRSYFLPRFFLKLFYWVVSRHAFLSRWPRQCKGGGQVQARLGGGWVPGGAWGLGQELAGWVIACNIHKIGAILVQEAGCKGLQRTTSRHRRLWRSSGYVWSGFGQCCSCVLCGPAPSLPIPGKWGDHGGIHCKLGAPANWKAACDHFDAAIVLSVDVVKV